MRLRIIAFGLLVFTVHLNAKTFFYDGISIGQFLDNVRDGTQNRFSSLDGIDSIEPMSVGEFSIKKGNIFIKISNILLTGLKNARLHSIDLDLENNVGSGQIHADVTLTSEYDVSGKFLFFRISNTGKFNVYGHHLVISAEFKFKTIVIGSQVYFHVYDIRNTQKFEHLEFRLSSNNCCEAIDSVVNTLLNANWERLQQAGTEHTSAVVSTKFEEYLNNILHQVPVLEVLKYVKLLSRE